ncbi:MAG TPA: Fur family transcriptional regulator [Actinomycetota bacterium]|nr:Fur family transcriptional regulator [Actinomycetota bacterium]
MDPTRVGEDQDLDRAVARRLSEQGQRYTPQRRALVRLLRGADRPLAIRELLRRATELPMSSVYRNLVILEQAGVAHRLVTGPGSATYELAEDLTEHHHHLICTNCGSVEDLPASSTLERTVRTAASGLATRRGFRVRSHRVDILGLCRQCA